MAAQKKSSKKSTPQVMDVSKPGKTPPSSTSKPIIVGHGPRVGDPMVSDKPTDSSSDDSGSEPVKVQVSRTSPKVIKPLSELDKKTAAPEAAANEKEPEKSGEAQDNDKPYVITVNNKSTEEKSAPEIPAPGAQNDEKKDEPVQTADEQKVPEDDEKESEEEINSSEPEFESESETSAEKSVQTESAQTESEAEQESEESTEAEASDEKPQPETEDNVADDEPENEKTNEKTDDQTEDLGESSDLAEQAAEETATVNAVASRTRDRSAESKQADEERKRQEHIAQLIQNKKYFLPIRQSRKHRQKKYILLFLLVTLLALAGLAAANGWLDVSGIDLPGGLSSKEQSPESDPIVPAEEEKSETGQEEKSTASDAVAKAKDTERKTDIDTIATNLDGYFARLGNYPTLENLNDETFRSENLKSLPEESLKDPDGVGLALVETPAEKVYAYTTLPENCDNEQLMCASYTLTATLSDGETYQKQSQL